MSQNILMSDDDVADLIASEARESALKYSTMGVGAFTNSSRQAKATVFSVYGWCRRANSVLAFRPPAASKIKPNTRFLRHIIKETKNHNEALLAREAAESQARLQDLAEAEEKKRRRLRLEPGDVRRRQMGDITAILQGRKRKRDGATEEARSGEKKARATDEGKSGARDESHRSRRRRGSDHQEQRPRRRSRDGRLSRSPERSRSPRRHRDRRKHKQRSRSPRERDRRHRQRSPLSDEDGADGRAGSSSRTLEMPKRQDTGRLRREDGPPKSKRREMVLENDDSDYNGHADKRRDDKPPRRATGSGRREDEDQDSDPLEEFVGPLPASSSRKSSSSPVKYRGRGAFTSFNGPSAMDSRFSEGYDPTMDVEPEADAGNWDEALEAYRDRQKWKQQGAARLKEAGFSDEQVKKWERGGERDIEDVRWTKKGEQREWDRGKAIHTDGSISIKADLTKWKKAAGS